jgi:hypothetical protein
MNRPNLCQWKVLFLGLTILPVGVASTIVWARDSPGPEMLFHLLVVLVAFCIPDRPDTLWMADSDWRNP